MKVRPPGRVVRVLPDVPAIDKTFDYLVPDGAGDEIRVGTMVRIQLGARRVGGWVVADGVDPPDGVVPRPVAKVRGRGPSPPVIDLCRWAAWRWAGRTATFVGTASPERAVVALPARPAPALPPAVVHASSALAGLAEDAVAGGLAVVRLPPAADPSGVVAEADARGPSLVLCPSVSRAESVAGRLREAGRPVALLPGEWAAAAAGGATVVGTRAAAFAPVPAFEDGSGGAVVVLDAHDEGHASGAAPTWSAVGVAVERARRAGVPCAVVSPCPTLEHLALGRLVVSSRAEERSGWAVLDVLDRRADDPRTGLFAPRLVPLLRAGGRVVLVLNRKGRARLLACVSCRELQRCQRCGAAVSEADGGLRCGRCATTRPLVCQHCGATTMKALRVGVSRVREELEALAGRPVGEVTGDTAEVPDTPVLVGTEAVLHRVADADAVCFLDFDQELLGPRYRAAEQALALLARAARLVGPRRRGGRVVVQTRLPRHPVVVAALHGDPARLAAAEAPTRAALRFPPVAALALISGPAAATWVAGLRGVEVLGPDAGRWLVRGPDYAALCDALAGHPRPPGRLRVEVDPLRV
jgi:primosomal protein N' (replication factor Y)